MIASSLGYPFNQATASLMPDNCKNRPGKSSARLRGYIVWQFVVAIFLPNPDCMRHAAELGRSSEYLHIPPKGWAGFPEWVAARQPPVRCRPDFSPKNGALIAQRSDLMVRQTGNCRAA
jgi:hypothetical protein